MKVSELKCTHLSEFEAYENEEVIRKNNLYYNDDEWFLEWGVTDKGHLYIIEENCELDFLTLEELKDYLNEALEDYAHSSTEEEAEDFEERINYVIDRVEKELGRISK